MTIALAIAALATRIAFFALAGATIFQSFRGNARSGCAFALASSAALIASSALGSADATRLAPLGLAWAALAIMTIALAKYFPKGSKAIAPLPSVILLVIMGLCLVLDVKLQGNLSASLSFVKYASYAAIGIALYAGASIAAQRNISLFSGHAGKWFAVGVALLALSLLVGSEANGAQSWVQLPGSLSIQPSEFAKVALVIAAAAYLAANASRLTQFCSRGIIPITLAFLLSLAVVVLQKDLGCALVLFVTLAAMAACSAKRGWVYVVLMLVGGAALALVAYSLFDHVRIRFDVWQSPLSDPYGTGYQYLMSMRCIANGGLIGCGLGKGINYENLPVAESDYIYAVLCEELGLAGCLIAIMCYVALVWNAARQASALPQASFERNVIAGIGCLIACEAFLIIGGVTNLIPLTGITLPLVSRGGSSLLASLIALGLMAGTSCSQKATQKPCESETPENEPRGTVYGKAADAFSDRFARGIENVAITTPRVASLALSLGLAACLCLTVQAQTAESGGLRLCGVTEHQNLRGSIVSSDGVVLAADQEVASEGELQRTIVKRVFPQDDLACHVLGKRSSGIEGQADLKGTSFLANLLAIPEKGDDLRLTINAHAQASAEGQLAGVTGAIVAIEPSTGRVLAMASSPTFDLAGDSDDEGQSFFNRATLGSYSPGSTFKLVSLCAALESETATPSSTFDAPSSLQYGEGDAVTNYQENAYGTITLADATNYSANTVFAQVGEKLGAEALVSAAERFGFNEPLDFCIGAEASAISGLDTAFQVAWASCGEPQDGSTLSVSPLQMALCMCAIANEGTIMQPYLIEGRVNALGMLYDQTKQTVLHEAISPDTASRVREILLQNDAPAAWCPYEIWGKTGTAENDGAPDNAWYVCTAEHDGKEVVVACVIEQGGTGASAAMPRAATVAASSLDALCAKR